MVSDELVLEVISLHQFFLLLLEQPETRKVYIRTLLSSENDITLGPSIQLSHLIIETTNVESHALLLLIFNSAPLLEKLCVASDWVIQNLDLVFSEIRWPRLRRIENPHGGCLNLSHFEARQFPRLLYWVQGRRAFAPRIIEGKTHAVPPYNEHIFWILQRNWAKWRAARTLWGLAYLRLGMPREIAWMLALWVLDSTWGSLQGAKRPAENSQNLREDLGDSLRGAKRPAENPPNSENEDSGPLWDAKRPTRDPEEDFGALSQGAKRPARELEYCTTQTQVARWQEIHLQETIIARTLAEEQYCRAQNLTSNRYIARAEERINLAQLSIAKRRRCIEQREIQIARLAEERQRAEERRKSIGAQGTLLGWLEGSEGRKSENTNPDPHS